MWSCWSGGEQVQVEKVGEKEVCAQAENDITDMLLTTHAIMSAADEKAAAEEALKKKAEEDAKQFEQSMKDGEAAFDRSDWSAAVACFTEAIDFDPMCGNAWAGRGGAWLRHGNYEKALADLNEALELENENLLALR